MKRICCLVLSLVFISSSCSHKTDIKPTLSYAPSAHALETLPQAFPKLTEDEKKSDWGKELLVATHLGRELDLYRASTAFKRARIFAKEETIDQVRQAQIEYGLLLCYWLSNKPEDVIQIFESGNLRVSQNTFPPYRSLLVMLSDSYTKLGQEKKAASILALMQKLPQPEKELSLAQKVELSSALQKADLPWLENHAPKTIQTSLDQFKASRKSPQKAALFNALLPGAGYLYVGQKQSALTSFLLNTLFITATYEFLHHGQTAAAIITGGFEVGWYVGGIRGASLAARQYNNALYSEKAKEVLVREKLFPLLMFDYAF
jgi:hypothetical protein